MVITKIYTTISGTKTGTSKPSSNFNIWTNDLLKTWISFCSWVEAVIASLWEEKLNSKAWRKQWETIPLSFPKHYSNSHLFKKKKVIKCIFLRILSVQWQSFVLHTKSCLGIYIVYALDMLVRQPFIYYLKLRGLMPQVLQLLLLILNSGFFWYPLSPEISTCLTFRTVFIHQLF